MTFANGAREALVELDAQPIDVLVSDITMPEVNGIELLRQVRERSPGTVRILMSGTTEPRINMHAVPQAHQFLSKPFDIVNLVSVIKEAISLGKMLRKPEVRRAIGAVGALPSVPSTYVELTRVIQDPDSALRDIVAIVERDSAMASRVLHMVNSAFFGAARATGNIADAVRALGGNLIRDLVMIDEVFTAFDAQVAPPGFDIRREQEHAIHCAEIAAVLADRAHAGFAYTAALLHDVGRLLYATQLTEAWTAVVEEAESTGVPLHEHESAVMGASHAELGAYMLGVWRLPMPIVSAIAEHHTPPPPSGEITAREALYFANQIAHGTADESQLAEHMILERARTVLEIEGT